MSQIDDIANIIASTEDAFALLGAVRSCIEEIRFAEIQTGPTCLRFDRLPAKDAPVAEVISWVQMAFIQMRSMTISDSKLKSTFFSPKSEKVLKAANKTEAKAAKVLDKKQCLSQKEYDLLLSELQKRIDAIDEKLHLSVESEIEAHTSISRLADMRSRLEQQRKDLVAMTVIIDDPKEMQETAADAKEKEACRQEETCAQRDDNVDKDTVQKTEPSVSKVRERKKSRKKTKKSKRRNQAARPDKSETAGVEPQVREKECNPAIGEQVRAYQNTSLSKKAEIMDESYAGMRTCLNSMLMLQDKEGNRFTVEPASCYEVRGFDKDGNVTEYVNSELLLYPDTPENEALKASLNINDYSPSLMDILTVIGRMLVFSPREFLGTPSRLYGMRPCFVRAGFSERWAIKLLVDFIAMQVSKSRIADRANLQWKGESFSKQYIISIINGLSRVLSPLATYMRRVLLERCRTMHNDDCTMHCLEWQKDADGNRTRQKNYLWGLISGAHEETQGAIYLATESRSTEEFLRQFGYSNEDGEEFVSACALENLVTDCYSVYIPGVAKLEEILGRKILRAGCYAHLRRYFLDALKSMKLSTVYQAACRGTVAGFEQRVDEQLKAQGIPSGPIGRKALSATFCTEVIFWLEEDFEFTEREELEQRRHELTSYYVDRLYAIVDQLKSVTKSLEENGSRDGVTQYKGGKDVPWGTAIVYALNNRTEMHAFLQCGDIECSNNRAERTLCPGKRHTQMMEFLATKDGFNGFADLLTIYMTCRLMEINPYEYIHWAFACAKMRLEDYRLATSKETGTTAQLCKLPRPYKKDGEIIGLYHKDYVCWSDKINWQGLDVWSYAECLDREYERLKPEYRLPEDEDDYDDDYDEDEDEE